MKRSRARKVPHCSPEEIDKIIRAAVSVMDDQKEADVAKLKSAMTRRIIESLVAFQFINRSGLQSEFVKYKVEAIRAVRSRTDELSVDIEDSKPSFLGRITGFFKKA